MADRIIIAQDSQSAESGTGNEKAQITLLDFATSPLKMQPTTLSSRYRQVPLEELVGMLLNLAE